MLRQEGFPVSRLRAPFVLFALALLLLVLFPAGSALVTDWWWFQEIGYEVVFIRTLQTQVVLFIAGAVLFGGMLFLNLRLAQRGLVPDPVLLQLAPSAPRLNVTAGVRRLSLPISLGLGVIAGFATAPAWGTVLRALNRTPFGVADPIFGRDIGYYVFTLPAISAALALLFTLGVLSSLAIAAVYWIRGDIVPGPRRIRIERSAALHLGILLAALFVLTALRLWFVDAPELLYSRTGPLIGASYTDLRATLPALRVSAVVAVLGAVLILVAATRGRLPRAAVVAGGSYLAVAILGRGVVPGIIQKFVVAPTELTRETPYLRHHIAATRRAWGIDSVEIRDLRAEAGLSLEDIRANSPTIENVRLWDREPLLQTYGQLQEIRTYYDFVSVDDDRYRIDGKYRQVLLSPRELNPASLPTRTFINEHLTFTHGMGITLAPVNQVTVEGLPVLFIKDLPPVSTVSLKVARPQIYYGEVANPFVFVKTRQREFDHPAGDANVYAEYEGSGGVPVSNVLRRLLLAVRFGSTKILFSGDITDASRALYNRHIVARAETALPFLRFDGDPYLVLAEDGTLKWILDAYTSTTRYPYAQRLSDGTSYMRNSVKVVIDAYHGSVTAYVSEPGDPLVRTWARIFPGIFVPLERMPADLRAHIRYPEDIYRVQTTLYGTYHMEAPEDFYHREDQWQIPTVAREEGANPFMRHIVMRLPDEREAEFVYMVPFTPRGKDNLAAWMVARNDGAVYGKLRVYRLPRQRLVFGPQQVQNRINQNTEIARQVSLWDQRGSEVIRGELLSIPIEESLLYVQPLYLRAEGGRIPELKRVIVAYENRVVMTETLEGGLTALFGGSGEPRVERPPLVAETRPAAEDTTLRALAAEARRRYEAALQAQREIDWARYGEEMRRLGELLERLRASSAGPE
jgi:uncharacterized membrane protein (UPF0182 family)